LSSDDLIYLCSDGVYNWIKLDKINAIIEQNSNYKIIANKVVNEAFTNKSNDNMTAIILKIK
jgi:serine/threonine protein phosphatase PrpC